MGNRQWSPPYRRCGQARREDGCWIIEKETGLFFDNESYELIVPGEEVDEERDRMIAGHRQIALAYDRAVKLVNGQDAETNFPSEESPPEESELVVLFIEALRQINALKAGRGWLH
jgi:hypothetical protein